MRRQRLCSDPSPDASAPEAMGRTGEAKPFTANRAFFAIAGGDQRKPAAAPEKWRFARKLAAGSGISF